MGEIDKEEMYERALGEIVGEHMIGCNMKDMVEDEARRRHVPYLVVKKEYIAKDPKMARWL